MPQDCDLWDSPAELPFSLSSDAILLAASRGPQFINVAFKLLERKSDDLYFYEESSARVMQLIEDEACDDYTVSVYIKVINYSSCVTVGSEYH